MSKLFSCILLVVIFTTMLCACNSSPRKQAQDLHDQVKAYGKLIRWRAFDDAKDFIRLREGGEVAINSSLLNEIRVTKYEVLSINLSESQDEAVVVTEISYYHERVNSVHEIRDEQVWWRDEESGRWLIDGTLPEFTP